MHSVGVRFLDSDFSLDRAWLETCVASELLTLLASCRLLTEAEDMNSHSSLQP